MGEFPRGLGDQLTFADLQSQSNEWRDKNFTINNDSLLQTIAGLEQLLGMVEEVGEIAHAELKRLQGIRGFHADDVYYPAISDGVGDLLLFTAGYCTRRNLNMQDCAEHTWAQVKNRDWKANPQDGGA
jgi:NTP pyrophosphatase (non-canonical NTP hydrolase)